MNGGGNTERADVHSRVTPMTITDLQNGSRTWLKPWNADHIARRPHHH
jgi:antirestriction protein ArdC